MVPWALVDKAAIPGGGILRLMRRGAEYSIRLEGHELMNSRLGGSERALATLACARLSDRPAPRVLIGGLGLGFTLRAALAALPAGARIVVGELVAAVLDWANGPLADIFTGSLQDPRVTMQIADVADLLRSASSAYDAILLDVDNGPDGLTSAANERLYGSVGLAAAHRALCPGGVLAIWSAHRAPRFVQTLGRAHFDVEEIVVRATDAGAGAKHVIWLATRRTSVRPA